MNFNPQESNAESNSEPLLPYYVYILLNRIKSNRVFYVGKGTGQRAGAHNRDMDRLLRKMELESQNPLNDDAEPLVQIPLSEKQQEIKDMKVQGICPLEVIVGRYRTEDEAFAVEATLIHFMFGHEKLTNVASGRGSKFIRNRAEFEAIVSSAKEQKDISTKPGVDEERRRNVRDNSYRDARLLGLQQAGAYDLLSELQNKLTDERFRWRSFDQPGDMRFHPSESNGYLAVIVTIGPLDFDVQFTKAKVFSVQFIYTKNPSRDEEVSDALKSLKEKLNLTLGTPKAGYKYSWFEPESAYREIDGLNDLLRRLDSLRTVLEPRPALPMPG